MIQYAFDDDEDNCLMISAEDQCWDKDTLKQLREEYNIVFCTNGDGVIPVMIQDNLVALGSEDDGTIQFRKSQFGGFENRFDVHWIPYLIADLQETMRIMEGKNENSKSKTTE